MEEYEVPQSVEEVIVPTLGDFYSDEQVDQAAEVFEQKYQCALRRKGESEEAAVARDKRLRAKRKGSTLTMAPHLAERELNRFLEAWRENGELSERAQAQVHEFQKMLGRPLTDFKVKPQTDDQKQKEIKLRYAEYVRDKKSGEPKSTSEKLEMIAGEESVFILQLLMQHEDNELVRETAEKRLAELEVIGA